MNLDELQQKLIAAGRADRPSERVPYAFEQRVMARLKARPALDDWALWACALWRAAAPCAAIMLLLGAWALVAPASSTPTTDLSQEFENTVLAAAEPDQSADSLW
jgi:hypothetical protein